jgi:ATP-dependent HslUV protease subunit HslV
MRSAVELAELWRSDKIGRELDAMMITADENTLLILSGTGEVIEPDEGVCAIGSGGNYALAAARALYQETDHDAETIAKKSLKIASEICVFTNDNIRCETVGNAEKAPKQKKTVKKEA